MRLLALALCLAVLAAFLTPGDAEARRYASIVVESPSGRVLHAANPDRQAYPASMTKMMTLYKLFEALDSGKLSKDSRLKVSRRAAGMPPSKLGLRSGSSIKVDDAIRALVTKSANDVAVVVAEALAGSEINFAKEMTSTARQLGMSKTTFRNASGLPDSRQLSTARDMATLSLALLQRFPHHYHYFGIDSFTYNGRTYKNHNKLLDDYPGVDGLKTGYIRASGFNLAASAVQNGRRIVAVVFGGKTSRSRNAHMVSLLDRGFSKLQVAGSAIPSSPPPEKPVLIASAQPAQTASAPAVKIGNDVILPALRPNLAPEAVIGEGDYDDSLAPGFGVQVGAFSDPVRAQKAARSATESAPSHLMGRALRISQVQSGSSTLYRARILGMDEKEARAACNALKRAQQPCMVVQADHLDLAYVQ